jgi:hypothetical protein
MNQIKFSHEYWKHPEPLPFLAELLQVFIIDSKLLKPKFITYDTQYNSTDCYPLPSGKLIVLLLRDTKHGHLFTTIRRHMEQKYEYYFTHCGEVFEMVMSE